MVMPTGARRATAAGNHSRWLGTAGLWMDGSVWISLIGVSAYLYRWAKKGTSGREQGKRLRVVIAPDRFGLEPHAEQGKQVACSSCAAGEALKATIGSPGIWFNMSMAAKCSTNHARRSGRTGLSTMSPAFAAAFTQASSLAIRSSATWPHELPGELPVFDKALRQQPVEAFLDGRRVLRREQHLGDQKMHDDHQGRSGRIEAHHALRFLVRLQAATLRLHRAIEFFLARKNAGRSMPRKPPAALARALVVVP